MGIEPMIMETKLIMGTSEATVHHCKSLENWRHTSHKTRLDSIIVPGISNDNGKPQSFIGKPPFFIGKSW